MKLTLLRFLFALVLFFAGSASAANVAPLGLELGVATQDQVRRALSTSQLEDIGINAYSDGVMLKSDGANLGIEGLNTITFIFDDKKRLAGVLMNMGKHKFDEVHGHLAKKYRVRDKNIPFVGNSYVRYSQGASIVELDAPHLSFEMEVRYLTNELVSRFKSRSQENEKRRKATQSEKF